MATAADAPAAATAAGGAGGGAGETATASSVTAQRALAGGRRRKRKGAGLSLSSSLSLTHNSTKILDHVFLGGQEACTEQSTLTFLKITHILNVSVEVENLYPETFTYLQIPVKDNPDEVVSKHFDAANKFLADVREAGTACLVHCMSGMSRSSTFVLAHMVMTLGMTLKDAITHLRERRPRASPNAGFMAQLIDLEKKERGAITIDLKLYKDHRFDDVDAYCL